MAVQAVDADSISVCQAAVPGDLSTVTLPSTVLCFSAGLSLVKPTHYPHWRPYRQEEGEDGEQEVTICSVQVQIWSINHTIDWSAAECTDRFSVSFTAETDVAPRLTINDVFWLWKCLCWSGGSFFLELFVFSTLWRNSRYLPPRTSRRIGFEDYVRLVIILRSLIETFASHALSPPLFLLVPPPHRFSAASWPRHYELFSFFSSQIPEGEGETSLWLISTFQQEATAMHQPSKPHPWNHARNTSVIFQTCEICAQINHRHLGVSHCNVFFLNK